MPTSYARYFFSSRSLRAGIWRSRGGAAGTFRHRPAGLRASAGVEVAAGEVKVSRPDESRGARELHGLTRTLVKNAVEGVTKGYEKQLEIVGVGYRAESRGQAVHLSLGYSHPIVFDIPQGIDIAVDKQTHITVTGVDRQLVGQVAAEIRGFRKPEPYKGKGVKYAGEYIFRKEGKKK